MVDAAAKAHGQTTYQTPVGFKYIGQLIREDKIALGGEESAGLTIRGHVPEKDGILACLLVAEMTAGSPGLKNDFPERLIAEFPPQIVLAQYEFERVPAGVAQMEATFSVRSHAPSGGDANATYTWHTSVPEEWRLGPGETWEGAQETTRSEEDINPAKPAGTPAAKPGRVSSG